MDYLTPVAAFVGGVVVASLLWWIWDRWRGPEPAEERPLAPAPAPAALDPAELAPEPVPAPAPPAPPALPARRAAGELRISQRVVLHLASQPRLAFGDVAPVELTQGGMTQALQVAQPALTKVLARLIDGGAVLEMRAHVSGASRRLKVYQLTALGESVAVDLRRRRAARTGSRGPQVASGPREFRPIVLPIPDEPPSRRRG